MPATARPRSAAKPPAVQLLSFECNGCGAMHQSPDANVPVGWSTREGSAWCGDCTRAGIPQRTLRAPGRRAA
ncbi:hypothetical protein [Novosphingobium huizhouense]|uniref:hypothetical protein n=1 Tax=Novosphingobium huizhouense TaxID=2866625 RepID=UPI001CD8AC26|nr:hypothetical protein [Novosphingobium huizhouense]